MDATMVSAADLYKSVDASGKITYSDHVSGEAGNAQVIKVQRVNGVTGNTATKGATSFEVTGDFNEKDVMAALQKNGLTGHVAQ